MFFPCTVLLFVIWFVSLRAKFAPPSGLCEWGNLDTNPNRSQHIPVSQSNKE
jgi:hypothetical protein